MGGVNDNLKCQAESAPGQIGLEAEPYPGYREELARHAARQEGLANVAGKALPGPLRGAFAGSPPRGRLRLADGSEREIVFQNVTAGLVAVLEAVESPLLEGWRVFQRELSNPDLRDRPDEEKIAAAQKVVTDTVKTTMVDNAVMVFCFMTPVAELRRMVRELGVEGFKEKVMVEWGDLADEVSLRKWAAKASNWYAESFATSLKYEVGGEVTFTAPPAGPVTG